MNRSRWLGSLLLVAAVLGFASCSNRSPSRPEVATVDVEPSSEPVSESQLQAKQERWAASGIDSYRYRFQWRCFCIAEYVRIVDIQVTRGVITSVTDAKTGLPLSAEAASKYRTIDGLFAFVEDAFARSPALVSGAFDPLHGYPTAMYIDYAAEFADEEAAFRIYSLTPARPFLP